MNIIKEKWLFLNSTSVFVPQQVKKLYRFGLMTLSATEVKSLRANARLPGLVWPTAKSKIWRLSKNRKLAKVFPVLLKNIISISSRDIVSVDFSDFGNDLQVLMFSKQTKQGRATPLYFEVLRYPIKRNSQNTFVMAAILNFTDIAGCKPHLVFDRGFAAPSIVKFLLQYRHPFTLRIKGGKHVARENEELPARNVRSCDSLVQVYEHDLRLVVTGKLPSVEEPRYLITNDFGASRDAVIDRYYHRFEIEEFFRDAKRLLGLEYVAFQKAQSLSAVLWFVMLGLWCLWKLAE